MFFFLQKISSCLLIIFLMFDIYNINKISSNGYLIYLKKRLNNYVMNLKLIYFDIGV